MIKNHARKWECTQGYIIGTATVAIHWAHMKIYKWYIYVIMLLAIFMVSSSHKAAGGQN